MIQGIEKLAAVCALASLLAACGGGGGGGPEPVAQVSAVVQTTPPRPKTVAPGLPPSEVLLASLMDGRDATDVLPAEAYTTPVFLPAASIDLTVDRRLLLQQLFSRVTAAEPDPIEAWVEYLQDRVAHPTTPPMHEWGINVYDPLWILENRLAWCGQINRVLVDGLLIAGFDARMVQLNGHQAAEVWLDGQWRYLDADFANVWIRKPDGTIPSAQEIHDDPSLLDSIAWEPEFLRYPIGLADPGPEFYAQVFEDQPYYYVKTATLEQERDPFFGWNSYYETVQ